MPLKRYMGKQRNADQFYSSIQYILMSRDLEYFQKKVRDLQIENEVLREQLSHSSRIRNSVTPQVIIDLHSRNERLERQALKYEKSIKNDLSTYLLESTVQGECFYRNRYNHLLNEPKNHYKLYF